MLLVLVLLRAVTGPCGMNSMRIGVRGRTLRTLIMRLLLRMTAVGTLLCTTWSKTELRVPVSTGGSSAGVLVSAVR